MDAKELKELTSELSLLYVEDDDDLRYETYKLFSHLFKTTEAVENGQVAFEAFENNTYDLIITDLNMPIMDGVTLSKKIKEILPTQSIVITSAHDESSYLLELIDIGIDKFILKPLDMQKMLKTLSEVCTHIQNKKLIKRYKKEIEVSNKKLTQKNDELASLVKILDTKIIQLNANKTFQTSPKDPINTISSNPPEVKRTLVTGSETLYIYNEYMMNDDLLRLSKVETNIETIFALFKLQDNITQEAVLQLAKNFNAYASLIKKYSIFKSLGTSIETMAKAIQKYPNTFIENCCDIHILLESFIYVLKKWRLSLFTKGIKDPNVYDVSMINDIKIIISFLEGKNKAPSKLEFV